MKLRITLIMIGLSLLLIPGLLISCNQKPPPQTESSDRIVQTQSAMEQRISALEANLSIAEWEIDNLQRKIGKLEGSSSSSSTDTDISEVLIGKSLSCQIITPYQVYPKATIVFERWFR